MNKGKWGEKLAELYLEKKGYLIVERNVRCRYGEIDLVAVKGYTLCFVEVKLRSCTDFGFPAESVNERKQRKLRAGMAWYLQRKPWDGYECRVDVLEILLIDEKPYFHHIPSAFS